MTDNDSAGDMNKALFVNLVMMFTSSAMQQLGKLVDPQTRQAKVDLPGAQVSIDMLSMLRDKTKGNLDRDEERLLEDSLASLQLNYVQTAAAEKKSAPAPADTTESPAKPDTQEAEPKTAKPTDDKNPKYHKSYGG